MKKEPLVSIIIPVYNRENLVGETLDSVIAQTYQNWECIVVDDGSTDRTRDVVQSYCDKDSRIKLFSRPNERPKGANACRNYGFELSQGEFINWFDSDDLMMPDKLTAQLELLTSSVADFVVCKIEMRYLGSGASLDLKFPGLKSSNPIEDFILGESSWLTNAPLWRRCFIERYELNWDETLLQAQDFDFHVRALLQNPDYEALNLCLAVNRRHRESISDRFQSDSNLRLSYSKARWRILNKFHNELSKPSRKIILYALYRNAFDCFVSRNLVVGCHLSYYFFLAVLRGNLGRILLPSLISLGVVSLFCALLTGRGERLRHSVRGKLQVK